MNFTYNNKFKWRVDPDGMLRVTARVLSDGVFPYLPAESPEGATVMPGNVVMQYIPKSAFTKQALETLEGKPVIVGDHVWRDADNTHKDGRTVGAVAGTPRVKDGFVEVDLLIDDADTVEQVMKKQLVEISASYMGECTLEDGVYKGKPYGAVQGNLRFNHVLLLPEGAGRCGSDVRILNHNKPVKGETMSKVVKMTFGNRSASFTFSNEDDAKEAERMTEEQKSFDGAELEKAMNEATEVKGKLDELQAQYDAAMQTIAEQKAQIDELMSAESQSAMAAEAAAQTEAEGAILDDAVENEVIEEGQVEEIKNECEKEKTFANRRRVIVQNAMSLTAEQLSGWTQDAVDGAFETLAHTAMRNAERRSRSTMGGVRTNNATPTATPLERILRPMKLNNSFRPGKKSE